MLRSLPYTHPLLLLLSAGLSIASIFLGSVVPGALAFVATFYLGAQTLVRLYFHKSLATQKKLALTVGSVGLMWVSFEFFKEPNSGAALSLLAVSLSAVSSWFFLTFQTLVNAHPKKQSQLPSFPLQDQNGNHVFLSESLHERPAVFLFVRGTWCGFCNQQLREMSHFRSEFKKRSAQLVIVSGETPADLKIWEKQYRDIFIYVSDPNLRLADYLGIRDLGATFINVRSKSGPDAFAPTVTLVNAFGEILSSKTVFSYAERPTPQKILDDYDSFIAKDLLIRKVDEQTKSIQKTLTEKKGLLRILLHDIANTQTVITASVRLASRQSKDPKMVQLIERIKRATDLQIEITTHARNLEAVSSGKLKVKFDRILVNKIFEDLSFIFLERFEDKGVELLFDLKDYGLELETEHNVLVNQVLGNVISNALKFTPPGKFVRVEASCVGEAIQISVTDRGVGIEKDRIKELFDPTKATSTPGTNGERGTGFGMPIMKSYVEYLGGSLKITSETAPSSSGTTVTLCLKAFTKAESPQPKAA